jgi:REP element-mobilizing transposase RayT
VNGERIFTDPDKEILRIHIWQVADYCGLEVVTYSVLTNHFHVVLRVPKAAAVSDRELLRRYSVLHRNSVSWQRMRLSAIERMLDENGERAHRWRLRQLAMMGDISPYMQLLKQRFSIWFNKCHDRFGTLWAERFKSVLLDADGPAVRACAAYVDLNAVRAGLAADPKEYRFCGYAEAMAGDSRARAGVAMVCPGDDWEGTRAAYHQLLFPRTESPKGSDPARTAADVLKAVRAGGRISFGEMLRCRSRYLTDGAVLGSKAFVLARLAEYRRRTGRGNHTAPRPIAFLDRDYGLNVMRNLKAPGIG